MAIGEPPDQPLRTKTGMSSSLNAMKQHLNHPGSLYTVEIFIPATISETWAWHRGAAVVRIAEPRWCDRDAAIIKFGDFLS